MKNRTQPFVTVNKGNVVQLWLGTPKHPESDFILSVDETLIPALIAALSKHKTKSQ